MGHGRGTVPVRLASVAAGPGPQEQGWAQADIAVAPVVTPAAVSQWIASAGTGTGTVPSDPTWPAERPPGAGDQGPRGRGRPGVPRTAAGRGGIPSGCTAAGRMTRSRCAGCLRPPASTSRWLCAGRSSGTAWVCSAGRSSGWTAGPTSSAASGFGGTNGLAFIRPSRRS